MLSGKGFFIKVAYQQAVSELEKTQKQVSALETEAVKALTGESQLDLSVVNGMLLKLRVQLDKDRHLIIAALIDRVEVNKNYEVKVFFKVSAEQFLGKVVRIA